MSDEEHILIKERLRIEEELMKLQETTERLTKVYRAFALDMISKFREIVRDEDVAEDKP